MKKGCMSCYFHVNSQRQKTSEDTASMYYFLMFDSNLMISHMRWKLKVLQVLSRHLRLQMRPISKPLKMKMQHLHCSMMICKIVTTKYRPVSMKTWHCKHKGMYIRTSYKNVKTSLPILRHAMFLMQKIQAKVTLLGLLRKIPPRER